MSSCEMCGKEETTVLARIEGVDLRVCKSCASFGTIIKRPVMRNRRKVIPKAPEKEKIEMVKEDYNDIIRHKREKLGLKQKEFAKFLAEKESLVHKIESGEHVPSIELAKKMEKQLGISLIEVREVEHHDTKVSKNEFTIGDMIKVK